MAPLLFALDQALEARGWTVIAIDYRYSEDPGFQAASDDEKDAWFEADALAVGRWVAQRTQGCRVVYAGKSLGTSMLLHQVNAGLVAPDAELVWLTPGTRAPQVYQALRSLPQRSLVAYGTADPYAPQGDQRPVGLPRVTLVEVPGAGHILEVPGDVRRSLSHVADVVEAVLAFVDGGR